MHAGEDQTVVDTDNNGSEAVILDGSGSSDSDGTIVSYVWSEDGNQIAIGAMPAVSLDVGDHTIMLTVTDNDGDTDTDTVVISVEAAPNVPPTADAGDDQTFTIAAGQTTINVLLDGTGSSDVDGTVEAYNWTGTPNPADVAQPVVSLGAGVHEFTLVATDDDGANSNPDTVIITVNCAPVTLSYSAGAGGSLDGETLQVVDYGGDGTAVTAVPDGGYYFVSWSDGSTDNPRTDTNVTADVNVIANFAKLAPELSLIMDDGVDDVEPGDTISYVLTYTNTGGDATGVVITETVPANTTFDAASSDLDWACEPDGTCTLDLGEVAHNESDSVIFAVTVDDPLEGVSEISNTAEIGDDGSGGVDSNPDNNTSSVSTTVIPATAPDHIYYFPIIFK